MQTIDRCPVCANSNFTEHLTCTDHTVSHETFALIRCQTCSLVITSPQPDPNSLGTYYQSVDYISHSTKARSIFDRVYRVARSINLSSKINLIKNISRPGQKTLLDYGCGTGEFLRKAKACQYNISGVEPSENARTHAAKLTGEPIQESLSLPPTQNRYDIVTLWHALEHIPDLNETLAHLANALCENGMMFIAVPNHLSADAHTYGSMWAGYDVPRHLWHFNQPSMELLLKNHSLKLLKIIPMKIDAFYVSMLSEQYISGRKNLLASLRGLSSGIRSNLKARKTNEYSSLIYVAQK